MLELNKIYCMDCLDGLKLLSDNCIDMTITSPPYDDLRKYNGYSFDFENIAKELYRVTKDGGVIIWVVNDSTTNGSESCTSFKQALYFRELGFNLHDTMIYRKQNYMPLTHNRYEQEFEYMFCFSKGKPKTFNPIMIICKYGGTETWGNPTVHKTSDSGLVVTNRRTVKDTKQHGNIFTYTVGSVCNDGIRHPAPFPEQLVQDQINTWSNEGDIILDCFMGSGTTAKVSILNNRKYVGFEISEEYCKLAESRIECTKNQLKSISNKLF